MTPILTLEERAIVVTFDGTEVMRWTAPDGVEDIATWAGERVAGLKWAPSGSPTPFVYSSDAQAFELAAAEE